MRIIVLVLAVLVVSCYLELPLKRMPANSKHIDTTKIECNKTVDKVKNDTDFSMEICFLKDIAYVVQLFYDEELYNLAIDTTVPVSWIKNSNCRQEPGLKQCTRTSASFKNQLKEEITKAEEKMKLKKHKTDGEKHSEDTQKRHRLIGMDSVQGTFQKLQNLVFWTKNSNKLANLFDLLLVGLFFSGEKDQIPLKQTNFINASLVSQHADKISDGAISMRFDDDSQNSFLNQIFAYVGETDKVATVYIGDNSTLTIGELSIKNAQEGYAGISWIQLKNSVLPLLDQLTVTQENSQKTQSVELSLEAMFTLSASYISIPKKQLDDVLKILGAQCSVVGSKSNYVQCTSNKKLLKKSLVFEVGDARIDLSINDLIRQKHSSKILLNIRQSDPQNPHVVMGEPFFKKYFAAFHYSKRKIGIALRRVTAIQTLFQVITLVRFLTFVFVSGCCFLICYRPIRRIIKTAKLYYKVGEFQSKSRNEDQQRLRYSDPEQNPYGELAGKIQEIVSDSSQGV